MSRDVIHITGQLSERAHLGAIPNTTPPADTLVMRIQPAKGLPYLAVQMLGSDDCMHTAAQSKLHLLRGGDWVRVYAASLRYRHDHGIETLVLDGITDVIPLNTPANRIEAKTQET